MAAHLTTPKDFMAFTGYGYPHGWDLAGSLARVSERLAGRVRRWRRYRSTRAELAALNDHLLNDIGVMRADISIIAWRLAQGGTSRHLMRRVAG